MQLISNLLRRTELPVFQHAPGKVVEPCKQHPFFKLLRVYSAGESPSNLNFDGLLDVIHLELKIEMLAAFAVN
jgi:hypothetical protein